MATKIYKSGNYIVINDNISPEIKIHAADTVIVSYTKNAILRYKINDEDSLVKDVLASDIVDENGAAYSDFETWKDENTGEPTSAGASGSGGATSAKQDIGNTSLSSIDSKLTNNATTTKQDTGNASLASIDSKLTNNATTTKQDTGNASLASIDGKLTNQATGAKQDTTNTALGSPGDPSASSDTGTFSIIAFIKRGLQNWSTFLGRFPSSLGSRGGLRVENPSQVNFAFNQTGVITINTDLLIIDCIDFSSVSIQCSSMGTTGVVTPSWSNDGTNYPPSLTIMTPSGSSPATITAAGIWTTQIYGRYLRLRLTTATTAGTTTFSVQGLFGVNNLSYPTQVISGAVTQSGTWTAMIGNTPNTTPILANPLIPAVTTTGDTGAKTATGNGATQTNTTGNGALITINLGAVTGTTPTAVFKIQGSADGGTTWLDIPSANTASIVATGAYGILINKGISSVAGVATAGTCAQINSQLPRTWRLVWTIGGTTPSFTITNVQVSYLF